MNNLSRFELESQLFGIIKTLNDLQNKIEDGSFDFTFYRASLSEKINELYHISNVLSKKGLDLDDILDDMNLNSELKSILPRIKKYNLFQDKDKDIEKKNKNERKNSKNKDSLNIGLKSDNRKKVNGDSPNETKLREDEIQVNPIIIAKIASDITSDFITILDFFKLNFDNIIVLKELLASLVRNLQIFPTMSELAIDISLLNKELRKMDINDNLSLKFESFYLKFKKKMALMANQF